MPIDARSFDVASLVYVDTQDRDIAPVFTSSATGKDDCIPSIQIMIQKGNRDFYYIGLIKKKNGPRVRDNILFSSSFIQSVFNLDVAFSSAEAFFGPLSRDEANKLVRSIDEKITALHQELKTDHARTNPAWDLVPN